MGADPRMKDSNGRAVGKATGFQSVPGLPPERDGQLRLIYDIHGGQETHLPACTL
jgi:hypothetical protein